MSQVVWGPSVKVTVTGDVVQRGAHPTSVTRFARSAILPVMMVMSLIVGILVGIGITLSELRWRR